MSSDAQKSKLESKEAKLEAQWNKFWSRLQRMTKWKDLLNRVPLQPDVRETVVSVSARLCWELSIEDRDRLQGRLDELNLATLNQVSVLKQMLSEKSKADIQDAEHGAEELCRHHESMRYLSPEVRKLVVQVLAEKLRQISNGQLPSGLAELAGEDDGEEELKKALKLAEKRADEAEEKAAQQEEKVRDFEFKVEALEKESEKRRQELRKALEREEALTQELAAKTKQVEELQSDNSKLKEQVQGLEEQLNNLNKQIEVLREKLKELDIVKEELSVCRDKLTNTATLLQEAESESVALKEEYQQMEKQIVKMEKAAVIAQTKLREKSEDIAALQEQVKEMHAALAQGGPAPMKMPRLQRPGPMKSGGGRCWERLHEDATARVTRLKQLQEQYAELKQQDVECALKFAEEAMRDYHALLERIVLEEQMRWQQRNPGTRDVPFADEPVHKGWTWDAGRGWVSMTLPSEVFRCTLPDKLANATATQWVNEVVGVAPERQPVRRLLPLTGHDRSQNLDFAGAAQVESARESRRVEAVQLPSLTSRRRDSLR
eukprot:TRINITY_DN42437_c0_g1_i1.p1 TRINITY_DN42437_c0_g1~~TRINITY_DN42437_c0_g1_i1.p1  ORF type:complete len:547 (+),score=148.15 TRINITY_DN42437_c0_g1_i1:99-1739(+)